MDRKGAKSRNPECKNCGSSTANFYMDLLIEDPEEKHKIHVYICRDCNRYIGRCKWNAIDENGVRKRCTEVPIHPMIHPSAPHPYCGKHYKEWKKKSGEKPCRYGESCTIPNCRFFHSSKEDDE